MNWTLEECMKRSYWLLLSTLVAAPAAQANDFPTSSRVEYVLECMQKHESKYEYLYKCSCVIDQIAGAMRHDDYLDMSTSLRNQTMAGHGGGLPPPPPPVKEMASKYKAIQASANQACHVSQR